MSSKPYVLYVSEQEYDRLQAELARPARVIPELVALFAKPLSAQQIPTRGEN